MTTGQLKLPAGREEPGPFMRVELAREPILPSPPSEGAKSMTKAAPDKHLVTAGLLERNQRRLATAEDQHTSIHTRRRLKRTRRQPPGQRALIPGTPKHTAHTARPRQRPLQPNPPLHNQIRTHKRCARIIKQPVQQIVRAAKRQIRNKPETAPTATQPARHRPRPPQHSTTAHEAPQPNRDQARPRQRDAQPGQARLSTGPFRPPNRPPRRPRSRLHRGQAPPPTRPSQESADYEPTAAARHLRAGQPRNRTIIVTKPIIPPILSTHQKREFLPLPKAATCRAFNSYRHRKYSRKASAG